MRAETLTVGARPVRVWRGGEGPPLVLLQGGMADAQAHWASVWDALAERYAVVAPDWPGFGGSAPLPHPTWPKMLAWLSDFQAAAVGAPAAFVGNSFGATLARLYAAAFPEAATAVVMINGGGLAPDETLQRLRSLPDDPEALEAAGRAALSREALSRMVAREETLTDAFVAACQANPAILQILRDAAAGPAPADFAPRCPALVLWGEADRHTPADLGRAIATGMPGADFVALPRAGHLPQLEAPSAVAAALIDFLDPILFEKTRP
ncbi:MAG TPA: alpha/beta fold hydrolase [Caulobacteraceae bacterium]|nr:alpha/beta fold hydrolase [Caulobacteraceae bacterium]